MSRLVVVLAAVALGGCTTVKIVQRDGCWVRETKKLFSFTEELGPCGRPEPKWSDDRLTRVTQECVAQADYRWQNRAREAWSKREPMPERPSDETVLRDCMEQVSRSQLAENERLRQRLAELSADKAALADRAEKDRTHLMAGYEKMAGDLGLAAQRPVPPAIATASANSEGRTTSQGNSSAEPAGQPRSAADPKAPAPAPVPAAEAKARPRKASAPAACETPAPPIHGTKTSDPAGAP